MTRRLSPGGRTGADSLLAAGFDPATPGVAVVETASPRRRVSSVLVRNAWNVIPMHEWRELQRPYPPKMQVRAFARRRLASHNLRRAGKVVCLTYAMAELTEEFIRRPVTVAPVTLPMDAFAIRHEPAPRDGTAVVPGTVTWYKRPLAALDWLAAHRPDITRVRFLGSDDGSGARAAVEQRARADGLEVEFGFADRADIYAQLARAELVLLPSALESLGFALSEALWVSDRVVASPLTPHREVAARLGREPRWWDAPAVTSNPPAYDAERALSDWTAVAEVLGLEPSAGRGRAPQG